MVCRSTARRVYAEWRTPGESCRSDARIVADRPRIQFCDWDLSFAFQYATEPWRSPLPSLAPGLTCFADSIQNADIDGDVSSALTTLGDDLADIDNRNYSIPLVANWPNSFKGHVPSSSTTFESAGNDILQLTVRPPPFRSWFH